MRRIAAIDIGSNSLLLSVLEIDPQGERLLFDESRVTGLAKGLPKGSTIPPERLQKSVEALQYFSQVIQSLNVESVRAVATAGLRRAADHHRAKEVLESALGYPIELISGDREAELSFWSVQKDFADSRSMKLVFDIGGASTELIYGNDQGIQHSISLELGSVVLSDEFKLQNVSDPEPALRRVLAILKKSPFQTTEDYQAAIGVGVAGTMTTTISVDRGLTSYKREYAHHQKISKERIDFWRQQVLSLPLSEREKIKGLPANRADVFGAGLTIIYALCEHFQWNEVVCADSGVRFGLLHELKSQSGPTPK